MANSLVVMAVTAVAGLVLALGVAGSWEAPPADVPQTEITNGELSAKLYLPDAHIGYYRGTRFDWSGVIAALEYKGHNFYGAWYTRVDPSVHDFKYEGANIVVSTCSGATGPVEEFQTNGTALGFDEAKVGGTFIKIGVGVLRKDRDKYDFVKQYELVDPGKWRVETHPGAVTFIQELADPAAGYAYVYRKTVRLVPGKPQMVLEHHLKNTGRRAIQTKVYNHNFLVLDHQTSGPDFSITFPFELHASKSISDLARTSGHQLVFKKVLEGEDVVYTELGGFSDSPHDHEVRIENRHAGAGMLIRGDRPLSDLHFWAIRSVLAAEPFISMSIDPGKESDWNVTYEYYTLPPSAK
jgi:hypothetical protein